MMVHTPKVCILYGFGINCDHETAAVFKLSGGEPTRVHVNELVEGKINLNRFHILAVPGGFSFGDHLGSGRLLGNRMRFSLREQLTEFIADKKPIIGICNGFQVLVKTGLLPGKEIPDFEQTASLTLNNSGRYENRWVTLDFDSESNCIWTKGLTRMEIPVRHGEGRFVMPSESNLDEMASNNQLVTRYVDPNTPPGEGLTDDELPFPICPNGSSRNIAGICDPTGLIFGLMPHPEAIYAKWLHPHATRIKIKETTTHHSPFTHIKPDKTNQNGGRARAAERSAWEGDGLKIFRNAIEYVRENL